MLNYLIVRSLTLERPGRRLVAASPPKKMLVRLFSTVLIAITSSVVVTSWTVPLKSSFYRHRQYHLSRSLLNLLNSHDSDRYPGGEVIGSAGKIGSYLLHRLNTPITPPSSSKDPITEYPQSLNVAPVPHGLAPGCLSPDDTPIYACIPSSSIDDVWGSTLAHRRKDLVFLCNCIPSRHLNFDSNTDVTVAILHFGVSHSTDNDDIPSLVPTPKLNTSPQSPPTIIYGKHATSLGPLLQEDRVPVCIVHDPKEVQIAAARKLAWSSLMWLMCHDGNNERGEPVTVKYVHQHKSKQLQRLVEEVLPAMELLASESWTEDSKATDDNDNDGASVGSTEEILDYLQSYSMSISNGDVIPSRELAIREIRERNGLLLSLMRTHPLIDDKTSYHSELIRQVAGEEILTQFLESSDGAEENQRGLRNSSNQCNYSIKCTSSNLEFLFHSDKSPSKNSDTAKSAIVVGAGMMGSSIAYHLSMRGINCTVMDQRTNLLPPKDDGITKKCDIDPGTATSSSFAWLNSNEKTPLSYKQLNHLGMEVWRRHDLLKHIPEWCGSLVRTVGRRDDAGKDSTPIKNSPYYSCVGPLDLEESRRLEPGIEWPSDKDFDESEIYFYPEEGQVDPVEAVKVLRLAAYDNGVDFLEGVQISHLVRGNDGKVIGVEYTNDNEDAKDQSILATDFVVVAAGANSSHPILGISPKQLKLLVQPGVLAYAQSTKSSNTVGTDSASEGQELKRIFVDTIGNAHILRRPDKTIVVGGGKLIAGGDEERSPDTSGTPSSTSATSSFENLSEDDSVVGNAMIKNAVANIAPLELLSLPTSTGESYELVRVSRANRPMPSDGLPVIGYIEQGLYVAVTHSAITLGPMIGDLVSYEVWCNETMANEEGRGMNSNGFQILDKYRPSQTRFSMMSDYNFGGVSGTKTVVSDLQGGKWFSEELSDSA